LKKKTGDQVNVFTFLGVEYIGLETRREDYEKDKKAGTNYVEKLIQAGCYSKSKLSNSDVISS